MSVVADIAAPPSQVFAVVTDIARWPQLLSAVEAIEIVTPGPVGVGTRFRETRTMFGRLAVEEMTVAEIMAPQRFVLTAFNHGTRYRAVHLLEPRADSTRLSLVFEGRAETLTSRLFLPLGWLFAGYVRRQLEADLADLKRAVESGDT